MDFGKEFEKFATKDQGINSMYYNKIISSMYPKPNPKYHRGTSNEYCYF